MTRDRDRRLGRIEAAKVVELPVPSVLRVRTLSGETIEAARERFAAEFPHRPRGHNVLVVPEKPRTEAESEICAEQLREHQMALVANARRERIAIANVDRPANETPPRRWPNSPAIRPNGPYVVWKPQC